MATIHPIARNFGDCSTSCNSVEKTNGSRMKSERLRNRVRILVRFKTGAGWDTIIKEKD